MRLSFVRFLMLVCFLVVPAFGGAEPPPIEAFVAPGLQDLQFTVQVKFADTKALTKVGKDFANSYRVKTMRVVYKDPGMMRTELKAGPLTMVYVINGNQKSWAVGAIKGSKDVSKKPTQKQGLMDFGLLTKAQLADYNSRFVRTERVGSVVAYVYELRFKEPTENVRRLVWVDPEKKIMLKRQVFGRDDRLKVEYRYEAPKRIADDIWVPTVIRVYNAEGQLGAVSNMVATRVNTGVSIDEFRV